jgi:hypothetical protein
MLWERRENRKQGRRGGKVEGKEKKGGREKEGKERKKER